MLQVFIGMSDHAEAKRLTKWKEQTLIEAIEFSIWNDSHEAVVRLA